MKEKIFGIGLSRTGTTSLHYLLENLGIKSVHFSNKLMQNYEYDFANEYDAVTDAPVPLLYQKFDKIYPGSKFILTTRDKNTWLESMKGHFTHGKVSGNWGPVIHEYHQQFYHTTKYNRHIFSTDYDTYHAEVAEYFKSRPGDLLILNIDKGVDVKKICNFLGIPERNINFPKSNGRRHVTLAQRTLYNLHYKFYGSGFNIKETIKYIDQIKPISPVEEVDIQVFWAKADMRFDEHYSLRRKHYPEQSPTLVSFSVPNNAGDIVFLRFDIGSKIGFLNIHAIEIKNNLGEVVWKWDRRSFVFSNCILFIENSTHWNDKVVQLSTSIDPHFAVNISDIPNRSSINELTIDITLSKPGNEQFSFLSHDIKTPLSF